MLLRGNALTLNLLLWKWSDDFDTPAKRRKRAIKFGDINLHLVADGVHPAIGTADVASFRQAVDEEFGGDEGHRGFILEQVGQCVIVQYSDPLRFNLVPKLAGMAQPFGLNVSEF